MRLFASELPAVYGACTLSFPFKASLFCENHGLHYCCYIVYPDGAWAVGGILFGRKGGACKCGKHCGVCRFLFYCGKSKFRQGTVHLAYDLKHGEFCRGGSKVHRRKNFSRACSTVVPLVVFAYNALCAGGGVDTAFHLHKKGVYSRS